MNEETNVVENVQATPEVVAPPVNENKERIARENFVAMRRKLEEEEALRKQAEHKAAEAERKLQERNNQQSYRDETHTASVDEQEEDFGDPDDVALNKTIKKTYKKTVSKISNAEKELQELKQRLEIFEAKSEIDSLKDFNDIVSKENIQTFSRLYPDEYQTIMSSPNLRTRSKMAYNMIKNYGIAEASPLLKQAEEIKMAEKKIESNKIKPGSSASAPVSTSPLTKFGRYDAEGRLTLSDDDCDRINKEVRKKLGY